MATANFLTLEQVAKELAVPRVRIWRLVMSGQLPAINLADNDKVRPIFRVDRSDLDAFLQLRKTEVRNV